MMSLFEAIQALPISRFISESEWAFPTIETVHVLFLALVVGTISVVDLRLLGWASTSRRVSEVARDVLPITWTSFGFALVSGLLLFCSNAATYASNWPFRIKMALLLLAGANMLVFHLLTYRDIDVWDAEVRPPTAARLAGGLSLLFWILVVVFGRWVGFSF